jgi:hypothetical protein
MVCLNSVRPTTHRWYGSSPAWRLPMERDAKRLYGRELTMNQTPTSLTYRHTGLRVSGRADPVPVTIQFHARPQYSLYGLAPEDYPHVFADPGARSKHRMPDDDSLCLYYVGDPVDRRWTSDKGLLSLLDLTADHLFHEDYWRSTGGTNKGIWLGAEAPHGIAA